MLTPTKFDPFDPLSLDLQLSPDERDVRDTVRKFCADNITPFVGDWFERGELPGVRELAKEFGQLGVLGMHLEGYDCGGASAVHYGMADLEVRLRGAEAAVAARYGCGRADRLLRADRARRRLRPGGNADPRPPRWERLGA
jgi:alkylation response protein AidB-like acyl-CoA dehydrogenase